MTTIILTLVGILLAAVAALMVLWYGGESFDRGTVRADAATAMSAAIQVSDAVRLKEASEGVTFPAWDINSLVGEKYLSSVPRIPGADVYLMDETGCAGCIGPKAIGVVYAMRDTPHVRAVCADVRRSVGTLKPGQTYVPAARRMVDALVESRVGCSTDGVTFFVYSGF